MCASEYSNKIFRGTIDLCELELTSGSRSGRKCDVMAMMISLHLRRRSRSTTLCGGRVGAVGAEVDFLAFLGGGVGLWFDEGFGGPRGGGGCGGVGGEWRILAGTVALGFALERLMALEDAAGLSGELM